MSKPLNQAGRAALIAGAVSLAAPMTMGFEGLILHPNKDPIGKWEVCYGETSVALRNYTPDECAVFLHARQTNDFSPAVLKCAPGIAVRREVFASAIDAAYNAGPGNFCKSPMAAAFNRGDWATGCNAYRPWHTLPGSKAHKGLARRRAAEAGLCLRGAFTRPQPAPAPVPAPPPPRPAPAPPQVPDSVTFAALVLAVLGLLLALWSTRQK